MLIRPNCAQYQSTTHIWIQAENGREELLLLKGVQIVKALVTKPLVTEPQLACVVIWVVRFPLALEATSLGQH